MKILTIIGRKDKADFPALGLCNIKVKVDTGAYTSSMHCQNIREEIISGKAVLKCEILGADHDANYYVDAAFNNFHRKTVKSSTGNAEERYIVFTSIILFNQMFNIELSLTNRADMKFPVLLGRKLISNNFLVDTTKTNLSYKKKTKV